MEININSTPITSELATGFKISNVQINQLGENGRAFITWHLLNGDKKVVKSGVLEISGKEYDEWGNDDSYIISLAVSKLSLKKQ